VRPDTRFIDDALMAYRAFMTKHALFDKLCARYVNADGTLIMLTEEDPHKEAADTTEPLRDPDAPPPVPRGRKLTLEEVSIVRMR
jgi:hypothetical protein